MAIKGSLSSCYKSSKVNKNDYAAFANAEWELTSFVLNTLAADVIYVSTERQNKS